MGDQQRGFFLPGGVRDRPGTSAINAAALWLCVSLILHQTITKILSWLITDSQNINNKQEMHPDEEEPKQGRSSYHFSLGERCPKHAKINSTPASDQHGSIPTWTVVGRDEPQLQRMDALPLWDMHLCLKCSHCPQLGAEVLRGCARGHRSPLQFLLTNPHLGEVD